VYGEVPPDAVTVAEPLLNPFPVAAVAVAVAVMAVGCVMITVFLAVSDVASVTVTV
jgi:hypothetical protein